MMYSCVMRTNLMIIVVAITAYNLDLISPDRREGFEVYQENDGVKQSWGEKKGNLTHRSAKSIRIHTVENPCGLTICSNQ